MSQIFLLDTGHLVALLNRRDDFHNWATAEWAKIEPPLLTCEAVIVEACFMIYRKKRADIIPVVMPKDR